MARQTELIFHVRIFELIILELGHVAHRATLDNFLNISDQRLHGQDGDNAVIIRLFISVSFVSILFRVTGT